MFGSGYSWSVEPIARSSSIDAYPSIATERGIRRQQVAVERHLVDALDDIVEQAAEAALALAESVFRAAALDRDARELRHATDELEVAAAKACRCA
jgi:pilus assembly protein TadC